MPFPKPIKIHRKYKNLAQIASVEDGELCNLYFTNNDNAVSKKEIQAKKTLGYSKYSTNASLPGAKAGLGLFGFQPSVGNYTFLYGAWDDATPDTQIYTVKSGVDPITCGATAKFVTNGNTVEFEQANDTLYATNGVDAVVKMSSAGAWSALSSGEPLSGASTVAKYLSWHNFMMFAARTVAAPNKLNVSGAGIPETFSTYTKTFQYAIVGMKPMGDYQVVYTEKSIHLISGFEPSLLSFQEIVNPHPCVSHRSIVQYKGNRGIPQHIYLGPDYVWVFNGSEFIPLGEDGWDNIRTGLNMSLLNKAVAWFDTKTNQYRISVCTGANTANDTTYAYDFTSGNWVKLTYRSVASVATIGSPNTFTYWQDSGTSGLVLKENDGNTLSLPSTAIDSITISATSTTITVDSTTRFPSSGKFICGSEVIQYSGVTATEFTGCIRGADGTVAAAHDNNTAIYPAHKFKYSTVFLSEGEENLFKKYQVVWCSAKSATTQYGLQIYVDIDRTGNAPLPIIPLKTEGAVWDAFSWGDGTKWGSSEIVKYPNQRLALIGTGKEIKFSFEENTNIQQTELYSFEYRLRPRKIK